MFSLDCETTGVDFSHGARPFMVTTCEDDGSLRFWEWDVDPYTREVKALKQDIAEIKSLLEVTRKWAINRDSKIVQRRKLVGQNIRFDVRALSYLGITDGEDWPWSMTECTLILSHLLASNQPHNLTDLVLHYLGVDIQPFEDRLHKACEEARRLCRTKAFKVQYGEIAFASEDRADMPSAKEKTWKFDYWLPRAIAKLCGYEIEHPWWTVLSDYANADSLYTILLWKRLYTEVLERGLMEIYRERMKLLPVVTEIELKGITMSRSRLTKMIDDFKTEEATLEAVCINIADDSGYDLDMPKGAGINGSLKGFVFDHLKLPVLKETEGGNPSFDKDVLSRYLLTLETNSAERAFIKSLMSKRSYSTAIGALEGYERFSTFADKTDPDCDTLILHPNLNPTGTATLRASSNNPNGQNISKPKEVSEDLTIPSTREAFGPRPGYVWYCFDYDNIELMVPAYVSGEEKMIELFEKPDDSPYFGSYHLLNCSLIYPDLFWPLADKKGEFKKRYWNTWYQWAKNFGFAVQYGAGKRTADKAAHRDGSFDAVMKNLSKMTALNTKMIAKASRDGFVETIPDKTVNPNKGYPLLCTRTEWGSVLPTVPLNYFVQGTACWAKMKAMNRCHEQFKEWRLQDRRFDGRLFFEVHDELDTEWRADTVELSKRVDTIKRIMMQSGDDIGIPLRVSVSYHPHNWAQAV